MLFRSLILIFLLPLGLGKDSIFKNLTGSSSTEYFAADRISVRESTSELQVSVGSKLFVFGKAKGTLDKVKVGMHVLPFSQAPGVQGNESTFSKVAWKKLKNGSIQIQSSYKPWPATLTWTVLASGQLMLEASSTATSNFVANGWLGLGFDYPEYQLNQISWEGNQPQSSRAHGVWKNENYMPFGYAQPPVEQKQDVFFQPIQSVKLEFESVTVDVRAESPGIFFGMRNAESQDSNFPEINSDLGFLLDLTGNRAVFLPQAPSEVNLKSKSDSLNPLVLWFHFQ